MARRGERKPPPRLGRIALERIHPPVNGRPPVTGWDLDITGWTELELKHAHRAIREEVKRRKETE
jgi:hypothetical protein